MISPWVPALALAAAPHTVWSPTPMEERRDLVTDRPDLTESGITVDAGHVQVEADVFIVTLRSATSPTPLALDLGAANIKLGLTDAVDLQVLTPAFGTTFTADGTATAGVGDIGLRLKWNLMGNDGDGVVLGLMPWIVVGQDLAPTGGLIVPVSVGLPFDLALGTMVVGNLVPDGAGGLDGEGIVTASVSRALVADLGAYVEGLASMRAIAGDVELVASTGLTWLATDSLQLDAGARLPMGPDPRLEVFLGCSLRH